MIIGPKKVEKSREISKFYRDLRNSLYKRYKGVLQIPIEFWDFPKNIDFFRPMINLTVLRDKQLFLLRCFSGIDPSGRCTR